MRADVADACAPVTCGAPTRRSACLEIDEPENHVDGVVVLGQRHIEIAVVAHAAVDADAGYLAEDWPLLLEDAGDRGPHLAVLSLTRHRAEALAGVIVAHVRHDRRAD